MNTPDIYSVLNLPETPLLREEKEYMVYFLCPATRSLRLRHVYIGCTYVGNMDTRLRRHNGEIKPVGAIETMKYRPWRVLAVLTGFYDQTEALKIEYALQHPQRSKYFRVFSLTTKDFQYHPAKRVILAQKLIGLPMYEGRLKLKLFPDDAEPQVLQPYHQPLKEEIIDLTKFEEEEEFSTNCYKKERRGRAQMGPLIL
jgi:predicted GIY-YIG superfamily endonuclease